MRRVYQVPHVEAHAQPPATFETRQQRRAAERADMLAFVEEG